MSSFANNLWFQGKYANIINITLVSRLAKLKIFYTEQNLKNKISLTGFQNKIFSVLPPATSKLWEQSCPGKRLSGSQKASQGHCPQNGPIGSTISVGAQIEDIKRQPDWGPLRPQDVGRRAGVTEQEREIVWEGERATWKNARNVVKMTNTNFKHTTSTANTMSPIPIIFLFYCLEIFLYIFLLHVEYSSRNWPGHYQI